MSLDTRDQSLALANLVKFHTPSTAANMPQDSTETFFRKVRFWGDGRDAPPVFQVDGVSYLHVKVSIGCKTTSQCSRTRSLCQLDGQ